MRTRRTTPFVRDMLRADPDGTVVVPALVRVWRRADAAEKPQLAEVLSRWDTPIPGLGDALVTLIEELDATQPATTLPTKELRTRSALHSKLRWRILACLARQGPAASGALPRVLTILEREPEPRWRTQILTVLGTMDPSGSVVRPVFDAYLRDGPTPSERRIACEWRARLRPVSSEAIEDLLDRSPCDSIDEIARAALVIQDLGPRAMAATPMLLSALSDAQRWQLSTIVGALTALKTDVRPIRGALATRLARGDVITATELLPILDRLPAPPTPTRADVERAMYAAEPDVELAFALYALGCSGLDPATLDTCVGALSHPIPNMRWLAALALRNAGPRGLSALPALVAALERERPRESAESAPHGRGHGMLVGYRWDHIIGLEVLNVLASLGPAAKDSLPRISSALRAIFNLEADEVASCFPRQIHRIAPIPRGRVEVIADPELIVTGNRRHTATARGDFIRNMAADSEREPDGTWSVALRELQFPGEVYWSGPPPDLTLFLRRDSAGTLVVDAECRQLNHDGTTKELSTPRFVHFRPADLRTADRLEFAYRDTFDPDSWIEFSIANPFR